MLEMRLSDMSEKKNERRRAGGGGGRKKSKELLIITMRRSSYCLTRSLFQLPCTWLCDGAK